MARLSTVLPDRLRGGGLDADGGTEFFSGIEELLMLRQPDSQATKKTRDSGEEGES